VRGHKIPVTGKGRRPTLGTERFLNLFFKNIISIFNAFHVFSGSGVTDVGAEGLMPPWQLRYGPLFRNGPP